VAARKQAASAVAVDAVSSVAKLLAVLHYITNGNGRAHNDNGAALFSGGGGGVDEYESTALHTQTPYLRDSFVIVIAIVILFYFDLVMGRMLDLQARRYAKSHGAPTNPPPRLGKACQDLSPIHTITYQQHLPRICQR